MMVYFITLSAVLINLLLSTGDFFAVVCRVCPRSLAREGDLLDSGDLWGLHEAPALPLLYWVDFLELLSGMSLYLDAVE